MTDFLREYLLSIVAVSLLSTLAQAVLPKGSVRSALQFLCGLLLILVTIAPITKLQVGSLQFEFPQIPQMEQPVCDPQLAQQVAKESQEYVAVKAHTMGYTITVQVGVNQDTPYPYPETIVVTGSLPEAAQEKLSKIIETDLAIPIGRQQWIAQ